MARKSPTPMELTDPGSDSDSETERSRSNRSPSPEITYDDYQRVVREKEALKRQVEELTKQVHELTKRLQQQEEQARERHEELLRRLPVQDPPRPNSPAKGKRKKLVISGESGSEEEPAKQARTGERPQEISKPSPKTAPPAAPKTPTGPAVAQEETTTGRTEKTEKIPPVVIRKKERWTTISAMLKTERINFTRAKLTGEGIAVTPATAQDHRKLTRTLNQSGEEYHTYSLEEDKMLRAVIRGIPSGVPIEEVTEDLRNQGFAPSEVHRMTSRRTKQEMPLILVKVPQEQEKLLEVSRCCSLVVKVEKQRATQEATQCHRCQRFGHGQSRCTAQLKCVKCGEGHHSAECKKSRDSPAKCANCGGPHPASYRGCPSYPKKTAAKKQQTQPQQQQTKAKYSPPPKATAAKSFAEAARQKQAQAAGPKEGRTQKIPRSAETSDVTSMLAQMREMYSAMSAFFAKMPSLLQE